MAQPEVLPEELKVLTKAGAHAKAAAKRNRQHARRAKADPDVPDVPKKLKRKKYDKELRRLQTELIKLQEWVRARKLKVVVLFEGRDAAGKGGVIKRIAGCLNPRVCRVVALPRPTSREKTQWYFQRYIAELPAGGEIALFDRSWYNRAGVERVMGFCTDEDLEEFFREVPKFEEMLINSGVVLVKYWFSVSPEEQEKRFRERIKNPQKRWKLSDMDLEARRRWVDYSRAKDEMFERTDTKLSPWWVVPSDAKRNAHLNCIAHFLSRIAYRNLLPPAKLRLPKPKRGKYKRTAMSKQSFVPQKY